MADPQTQNPNPAPIDLSGGLVPKVPQPAPIDLSGGLIPKDSTASTPASVATPAQPNSPDPLAGRFGAYNELGEGVVKGAKETIKGLVQGADTAANWINKKLGTSELHAPVPFEDQNLQASTPTESLGKGTEAVAEFIMGDEALKSLSLAEKAKHLMGVSKVLEKSPKLAKAVEIGANAMRQGTVGTTQALVKGASPSEAVEQGAMVGATGGTLEALGTGLSALKRFIWPGEMVRFVSSDGAVHQVPAAQAEEALKVDPNLKLIPAGATQSAEQTTGKGLSAQEAGKNVQREAAKVRAAKGEALGEAKDAMRQSLPVTSTGEPVSMTFAPESKSTTTAQSILDEVSNAKVSIKDPGMDDVQKLAEQFASGKDADGNSLTLRPDEIDKVKRSLGSKIDSLKVQVKNGANGTALGYLKQLKSAFEDDLYNFYEKAGDAEAAQNARKLSGEYAKIIREQTKGPAATLLNSQKPEQIVTRIVSNGANSQSTVESLVKNMSSAGVDTLRDSVTKELYRRNLLPNGSIDMAKAESDLIRMGDAAKSLYGSKYADLRVFLNAASELQSARNTSGLFNRAAGAAASKVGAGAGAKVAGPFGAVVGAEAGEKIADIAFSKSGAVKIGISPTESVTLSPKQATQPKVVKLLSDLSNALRAGQSTTAIVNAILSESRK